MSEETQHVPDLTDIREGDILFDCPYCGKNMAIESAGAGLMATVPRPEIADGDDPQATIQQLDAALAMANQQIDRLLAEKEALQERRAFLEQIRITNSTRLERIAAELASLQDALDRALVLLAEVRTEKPA